MNMIRKTENGFFLTEEQMRQLNTQRLLAYKKAHLIDTTPQGGSSMGTADVNEV